MELERYCKIGLIKRRPDIWKHEERISKAYNWWDGGEKERISKAYNWWDGGEKERISKAYNWWDGGEKESDLLEFIGAVAELPVEPADGS